jgi:hypothetical protein
MADQKEESPDDKDESFFLINMPSWWTSIVSIAGQSPSRLTALYSTRELPSRPVAVILHTCGSNCGSCSATSSVFVTRISPSGVSLLRFHAIREASDAKARINTSLIVHPLIRGSVPRGLELANPSMERMQGVLLPAACFLSIGVSTRGRLKKQQRYPRRTLLRFADRHSQVNKCVYGLAQVRFTKSRTTGRQTGVSTGRNENTQLVLSETRSLIEECGWKGGDSGGSAGEKPCSMKPVKNRLRPAFSWKAISRFDH